MKLRHLDGLQDYTNLWQAMRDFTDNRSADTDDEIWMLQHTPVFTLGQAGKSEHLLAPSHIPVIKTDRGGQITYHGPGQLIVYVLLDLKRRHCGVRELVTQMEQATIALLQEYRIEGYAKKSAPGVYVQHQGREHKIASLGLRVRKGCCYHGLALNVDMDLTPFSLINPCGYAGLAVTQLAELLPQKPDWNAIKHSLLQQLQNRLS